MQILASDKKSILSDPCVFEVNESENYSDGMFLLVEKWEIPSTGFFSTVCFWCCQRCQSQKCSNPTQSGIKKCRKLEKNSKKGFQTWLRRCGCRIDTRKMGQSVTITDLANRDARKSLRSTEETEKGQQTETSRLCGEMRRPWPSSSLQKQKRHISTVFSTSFFPVWGLTGACCARLLTWLEK